MNIVQPIGRMFIACLAPVGRMGTLAAYDNLHPCYKVYTRWVVLVPVTESALLKEKTS